MGTSTGPGITNDTLYSQSTATGYVYAAFAMIILYDHVLCLGEEVELFWHNKFLSGPTLIFLANRYFLLAYGISCLMQIPLWTTPSSCEATNLVFYIANILLFFVTAIFASLRVYAISNKNALVGLGVLVIGVVPAVINLYTTTQQSHTYLGVDGICSRTRYYSIRTANILEIVICVCAVSTDLAVIVFTWRRTYKLWRDGVKYKMSTPLTTLVLRDGVTYFLIMLVVNIMELIVTRAWVNASSETVAYTSYILTPVSPILISHFLISLRQLSSREIALGTQMGLSNPTLPSTDMGNGPSLVSLRGTLGASLHFATPPSSLDQDDHEQEPDHDGANAENLPVDLPCCLP